MKTVFKERNHNKDEPSFSTNTLTVQKETQNKKKNIFYCQLRNNTTEMDSNYLIN